MYVKKPVNSAAPSNNKLWTAAEDATLREMAEAKATTAKIAKALGRTKASIWGRKSMLGIKTRLSSSKGHNISVPTTLSTKNRRSLVTLKNPTKKVVRVNKVKTTPSFEKISSEFEMLSKIAKQTGAKIVITFE